jgi:hypothetical protein
MFTKITFTAFIVAVTLSAPVLATQNDADAIAAPPVETFSAQWCSGPRQHTDFRCFKN